MVLMWSGRARTCEGRAARREMRFFLVDGIFPLPSRGVTACAWQSRQCIGHARCGCEQRRFCLCMLSCQKSPSMHCRRVVGRCGVCV